MSDLFESAAFRAAAKEVVERDRPLREALKASARASDPHTSHDAAASVRRIRESQEAILDILRKHGPRTDEQIYRALEYIGIEMSPSGARTRRSELVAMGLVVDSGERGKTASNRQTIKWRAV